MSGRRVVHEEHLNHEAWAIPYGDLITLLLAFFVVMYAISSVNEGKYRVVADSLNTAFGGPPKAMAPVQMGLQAPRNSDAARATLSGRGPAQVQVLRLPGTEAAQARAREQAQGQLRAIGNRIQDALSGLVAQDLVRVRQGADFIEVEIQSDILFTSGSDTPSAVAIETVRRVGVVLRDTPNAVRVEGYTDDQPISTALFRSNWELSAARAASVLHALVESGVAPSRLSMTGFGEFQPVEDNATAAGRNANRRVMLVILAAPLGADATTRAMPIAMRAAHPHGATS